MHRAAMVACRAGRPGVLLPVPVGDGRLPAHPLRADRRARGPQDQGHRRLRLAGRDPRLPGAGPDLGDRRGTGRVTARAVTPRRSRRSGTARAAARHVAVATAAPPGGPMTGPMRFAPWPAPPTVRCGSWSPGPAARRRSPPCSRCGPSRRSSCWPRTWTRGRLGLYLVPPERADAAPGRGGAGLRGGDPADRCTDARGRRGAAHRGRRTAAAGPRTRHVRRGRGSRCCWPRTPRWTIMPGQAGGWPSAAPASSGCPRTELFGPAVDPASWTYPVIVKPRTGSGSRGIHIVGRPADARRDGPLARRSSCRTTCPARSTRSTCWPTRDGHVDRGVPRVRARVDSGVSVGGRTVHDPELETFGRAVARPPG